MPTPTDPHKAHIRHAFTTQAGTYAASAIVAAEETRRAFIDFIAPQPTDTALDVATGPGFLALLLAERVATVTGLDLTPAMLDRAKAERARRGLPNLRFQQGDAEALPFAGAAFDVTTCGSAFHHFSDPPRVLAEMVRVTRPGGAVALSDIITSEDPRQAALHNQLEQWRDPSHARSLPLSELEAMFRQAGLRDVRMHTHGVARELDEWFAISHTPPAMAAQVRAAFIAAIPGDATGLGVHMEGERVGFTHTFAWVVGVR